LYFSPLSFLPVANFLFKQKVQGMKIHERKPIIPKKKEYQNKNGAKLEQV